MLKELKIANFAIIESLTVEFRSGLNALTGETGAGKSIIIDALNLVLGGRADTDSIRTGQSSASVEAVFQAVDAETLDLVRELGVDAEDGLLIVKRVLSQDGKNRVHLNGGNVTVSALAKIGDRLVDIHGQHDHQTLLHPETHLDLLDLYGKLMDERRALGAEYSEYRAANAQLEALLAGERDRLQREDLLKFQIGEIDAAGLAADEEETLRAEKSRLANAGKIHETVDKALNLLVEDEGSVCGRLKIVRTDLERLAAIDPGLEERAKQAGTAFFEAEDLVGNLRAYARSLEFEPGRLEEMEDRLAEIQALKRKYGRDIAAILEYRNKIGGELEGISGGQQKTGELQKEIALRRKKLGEKAAALARKREKAAVEFKKNVEKELRDLNMKDARLDVRFDYEADPAGFASYDGKLVKLEAAGIGVIEFLFAPNPGEDPRPLAKIASGGELSRVMLALKTILNKQDSVPVLVFDEVDAGIGGKVAEKVGARLKQIAANKQVFCITHLPQIAGMANAHYAISKEVDSKRTRTVIRELGYDERVEEIARMSGGERITETTRKHAREMIKSK